MEEGGSEMEEEMKEDAQLKGPKFFRALWGINEVLKHKVIRTCFILLVDF